MSRPFPCVITCHFEDGRLPLIRIPYFMHDKLMERRMILQVSRVASNSSRRAFLESKKEVVLDFSDGSGENVCSNVWIRFSTDKPAPVVEYLPEGGVGGRTFGSVANQFTPAKEEEYSLFTSRANL